MYLNEDIYQKVTQKILAYVVLDNYSKLLMSMQNGLQLQISDSHLRIEMIGKPCIFKFYLHDVTTHNACRPYTFCSRTQSCGLVYELVKMVKVSYINACDIIALYCTVWLLAIH